MIAMLRMRVKPGLLLIVLCAVSLVAGANSAYASPKKHRRKAQVKQQPVQQTAPPGVPGTPSTLEHQPATAPQVSFEQGKLTIIARNSILSEVLRAVKSKTGADVDVPSNASERVVGFFGPGPARDVLASLLNGSHFNYVLLGSPSNSNQLQHVILIAKSGPDDVSPPAVTAAAQTGQPPQPGRREPLQQPDAPQAEEAPAEEVTEDAPDAESDQAPQSGEQQSPLQNGQPGVRTPEQLLQELQRQQQQIQQQQQQEQPGAPQGIPQQQR
ncbi:MAG: hypothetical protein M3O09_13720 [Acidobacteriota bacterium]|nr:hypothetical protein [Acidobacteriota bacterium]